MSTSTSFTFSLPASSVSSVANRHIFKNSKRALAEVLHKYNAHLIPDCYPLIRKLPEEYADKLIYDLKKKDSLTLPVNETRTVEDLTHENYIKQLILDKVAQKLSREIPPDIHKKILDHCHSAIDRHRGTVLEGITLKKLQKEGYKVFKPVNVSFTKSFDDNLVVFGKVDGLIYKDDKIHSVVEIKNRKTNFFLPEYDLDQLAAYVFITGAEQGILVQQQNGVLKKNFFTKEELMSRWEDIVHNLREPISLVEKIYLHRDDPNNKYWQGLRNLYIYM